MWNGAGEFGQIGHCLGFLGDLLLKKYDVLLVLFMAFLGSMDVFAGEGSKAAWIRDAFQALEDQDFPRIKAISWWHENFDASVLRVDSTSASLHAYRTGVKSDQFVSKPRFVGGKLVPDSGRIYHAAFPDLGGTEDKVSAKKIHAFEKLVNKDIAWVYFSNNWYQHISFPKGAVAAIEKLGKVPFVRMMARSNFDESVADPRYAMQKIIDGDFDAELYQWARDAAATGTPLLVEFGTEVNGSWFSWNGKYNGAGKTTGYGDANEADGAERFRDAYRHIIEICDESGADNITWFFHVDAYGEPQQAWNSIENYYPGDAYIDWLGVSVYGPQQANEEYQSFSEILSDVYPQLTALSQKPIAILEFAVTELGARRGTIIATKP